MGKYLSPNLTGQGKGHNEEPDLTDAVQNKSYLEFCPPLHLHKSVDILAVRAIISVGFYLQKKTT